MVSKFLKDRYALLITAVVLISAVIVARLFGLQIIKGEEYSKQAQNRLMRNVSVKSPRGDILDRYGRPIVVNREGFSLVVYKEYLEGNELDGLILRLANLITEFGGEYFDTLPITAEPPYEYSFSGDADKARKEFLKQKKLPETLTAPEALDALAEYYKIEGEYTKAQLRTIVGVRYEMEQRLFSSRNPYTFASDVSVDIVTRIKERHGDFPGVDISTDYIRDYPNGSIASHIIGRVGIIYKDEYEQLKNENYGMNDVIGKDGIEKYLEKYLKGKDGVSSVVQNLDGKTSGILETLSPTPGNNAFLTIDLKLQKVLEESLERTIKSIAALKHGYGTNAGSAVVIDVNTGEILAIASYPTYNIATFNNDYAELYANPDKPMWNRAVSGQYAPGSTYKVLTAIAALESGAVRANENIRDEGVYKFYATSGYSPQCWIYTQSGRTHGNQNVTQAIENSCNYFFYESGRRMGIDTLDDYSEKFGLGDYTGVQYLGESKGILASREYKESVIKEKWYPGDTLQAAIGQSYHMLTPIQLANYIAAVANGGIRYKTQMVKSVKNSENGNSLFDVTPEVMYDIDMSEENYKAVINGMKKVSETGTASSTFANFGVPVGGKTGTADVSKGSPTGLFVAFAPFDNPQIAISVVVEHGGHGNYVAPVAKDVIAAYMEENTQDDLFVQYNTLIK